MKIKALVVGQLWKIAIFYMMNKTLEGISMTR